MASLSTDIEKPGQSRTRVALILLTIAVILAIAKPILPQGLIRIPDWAILPWDVWLQGLFDFVKDDLGLIHLTRTISGGLEWLLDITGNLLYGRRRWPNLGPIPWTAIAAAMAVLGYYLGGWRMAALTGGTFVWTALIGQWKLAMQTMSVLVVAGGFKRAEPDRQRKDMDNLGDESGACHGPMVGLGARPDTATNALRSRHARDTNTEPVDVRIGGRCSGLAVESNGEIAE